MVSLEGKFVTSDGIKGEDNPKQMELLFAEKIKAKGKFITFEGCDGSGKSTLAKALLRLNQALAGEILFADGLKANRIGYLPQQMPSQKDFPASVREVVASGCAGSKGVSPFFGGARRQLVEKNMARLGITDLAAKPYSRLSGGQQRRVLLARALCATEKILLLDEPVAGLDPHATQSLYETIARLNREEGVTVLMITHDLAAAIAYGTQILHMSEKPTLYRSAEEYRHSADFPGNREVRE